MNEVVTIENTEMQIREYGGQRVVTFKDIDTVHQRPCGTARKAFARNKGRLESGIDYFFLKRSDCNANSNVHETDIRNVTIPNKGITILTESGYLLLVKVFDDDLAWEVQRKLVNVYFRTKEETISKAEEIPRLPYQTSSTPIPKNLIWYSRNDGRMKWICAKCGITRSNLCHRILERLKAEYDLEAANRIYLEERGEPPKLPMDIVDYFPDLSSLADAYLDRIEAWIRERQKCR